MIKEDFRKHCEEQIERCIKLNDSKHLKEHELALGLLNENESLIKKNKKYKEVIEKAREKVNILRKAYKRNICAIPCTEIEDIDKVLGDSDDNI